MEMILRVNPRINLQNRPRKKKIFNLDNLSSLIVVSKTSRSSKTFTQLYFFHNWQIAQSTASRKKTIRGKYSSFCYIFSQSAKQPLRTQFSVIQNIFCRNIKQTHSILFINIYFFIDVYFLYARLDQNNFQAPITTHFSIFDFFSALTLRVPSKFFILSGRK